MSAYINYHEIARIELDPVHKHVGGLPGKWQKIRMYDKDGDSLGEVTLHMADDVMPLTREKTE